MDMAKLREHVRTQDLKVLRRPTSAERAPYLPLALGALMVEERLTFPLFLKVSEGEGRSITFRACFEEGEILDRSWCESLARAGIDRLYCREQDVEKVIAYLNNHLLLACQEAQPQRKRFALMRDHLTLSLVRAFQQPLLAPHLKDARNSLENLGNLIAGDGFPWKYLWELLYLDYTLYTHSVNVGIMAMAFLVHLGKPMQECLALGLAGLFHDLGFLRLDESLLHQMEPLDEEQWRQVKQHPGLGHQMVKNNALIPLDTLRLILEHHENADGSGYPQGLALHQQHPYTRILFIVEMYDGLTTYRPYRPAHKSFVALKILQEERGARGLACDPQTLKRFIKFLALT
jgi:HD-GYP domain-containing protein (c-di-GMP phosphodiesterase class II)